MPAPKVQADSTSDQNNRRSPLAPRPPSPLCLCAFVPLCTSASLFPSDSVPAAGLPTTRSSRGGFAPAGDLFDEQSGVVELGEGLNHGLGVDADGAALVHVEDEVPD